MSIHISNLSKEYFIHAAPGRETFREAIASALKAPFKRFSQLAHQQSPHETFWALKDVNFNIKAGEVVGIIGRNGAGKSTLLKILSRITEPTTGRIEINGRVGSLLEVGTGFHAELSGRENIFLNGAILGMTRKEIQQRFDAIVDFAEIEKFLDTPVKRYSSGMYMRLAFSVAAHLEPEILLVDEVLAVGDMEFQKKCLGKMNDIAGEGRTVIFVSHNMAAVRRLCERCIYLKEGQIEMDDTAAKTVELFYESMNEDTPALENSISRIAVKTNQSNNPAGGQHLCFDISYRLPNDIHKSRCVIGINGPSQGRLFTLSSPFIPSSGITEQSLELDLGFTEGIYYLDIAIETPKIRLYAENSVGVFEIKKDPRLSVQEQTFFAERNTDFWPVHQWQRKS